MDNRLIGYFSVIMILFFACNTWGEEPDKFRINVAEQYGRGLEDVRNAINEARSLLEEDPRRKVVLFFKAGNYPFYKDFADRKPNAVANEENGVKIENIETAFNLSGITARARGGLIFRGEGPHQTHFIFDRHHTQFLGKNTNHVTFVGIHFRRKQMSVTQGYVVDKGPGFVRLKIAKGFPTPQSIFMNWSQGRYLRQFTDEKRNPKLIDETWNEQVSWDSTRHVSGRIWDFYLRYPRLVVPYEIGALIGVKSKHGGGAYKFFNSSHIAFKNVIWTDRSRGVFRKGSRNISIINARIKRREPINGQTPCLSTPGGGPQIGQPEDTHTTGNLVKNFRAHGTGDDAIAFFNARGDIVNATIHDSFARCILLRKSEESVNLRNIDCKRTPIGYKDY